MPVAIGPFERALRLLRDDEHELAAGAFLKIGRENEDGRAFGFAAYCLSLLRASEGAIKASDDAIRLGYKTAPVYANRAFNCSKRNRHQEAIKDCDAALSLDPNLPAARYTRAFVCLQLHHQEKAAIPPEAVEDITRATTAMPDNPDVWSTAALIYLLASADRDRAAEAVRKAVRAGKSVAILKNNDILETLAGHPVYDEALKLESPPRPVTKSANPHLARPTP